jgi:hypothetical protein
MICGRDVDAAQHHAAAGAHPHAAASTLTSAAILSAPASAAYPRRALHGNIDVRRYRVDVQCCADEIAQ